MPQVWEIKRIHALLNSLGWMERKFDILHGYGVSSTKDLNYSQTKDLLRWLESEHNSHLKRMRGTVIHYLCIMPGYAFTTPDNRPDYAKINKFIQELGSTNPKRKPLLELYSKELVAVVTQVKAMYRKEVARRR
jgi:hypothetical protein